MVPYILIAAGLGLILTMVMLMRLSKRQQGVQRGLFDMASSHEGALDSVRREAAEAQTAATSVAERVDAKLAEHEPVVADVRARIEGVESRFGDFEERLASAAQRALEGDERTRVAGEQAATELQALKVEADAIGAAVQALRNTSDKRLAEFAARIEGIERALGLGDGSPTPKAAKKTSKPAASRAPEPSVISAMASPSVVPVAADPAHLAAADDASTPDTAGPAAEDDDPAPAHQDDDVTEIDEGSARWIFVVLGLMLTLAVVANIVSK